MKIKMNTWCKKYKLTKFKRNLKVESVKGICFKKTKSKLISFSHIYSNFLFLGKTKIVPEEKPKDEEIYEAVSGQYLEMAVGRNKCEKSLIAILQSVKEELETSVKYETMLLENEKENLEQSSIYETFDF